MIRLFFGILLLCLTPHLYAQDVRTLDWSDLMPEGEYELLEQMAEEQGALPPGHGADTDWDFMPKQIGTFNTVAELDGKRVRLPGFIVPLEYSPTGDVIDFLLVPYMGACIHTPPPPPNQIVFVKSEDAANYGAMWEPVWVTGLLTAEPNINSVGDTAYTLQLEKWEPYED